MHAENYRRTKARTLIKPNVELALLNIRSRFNVGAMFRTADAAGISKIHLLGYTPAPPHKEIDKVALGSEKTVPLTRQPTPLSFLRKMKRRGFVIAAVEVARDSTKFHKFIRPNKKLLLVVGHEVTGLNPKILKLADHVISIPMHGKKKSLNVGIAFGIVAYRIAFP